MNPNSERIDRALAAHYKRFWKVSNRYPLRVVDAYDGDLSAAARDDDATVAERVAEWERANGLEPPDWPAIGRAERDEQAVPSLRELTGTDVSAFRFAAVEVDDGPPDDAPPCDEPGCKRLGVVAGRYIDSRGTKPFHYCVAHDPTAYEIELRIDDDDARDQP